MCCEPRHHTRVRTYCSYEDDRLSHDGHRLEPSRTQRTPWQRWSRGLANPDVLKNGRRLSLASGQSYQGDGDPPTARRQSQEPSCSSSTTAGAEANQTALSALQHRWPDLAAHGLRALKEESAFYVSREPLLNSICPAYASCAAQFRSEGQIDSAVPGAQSS
jgi:hypothetical protein